MFPQLDVCVCVAVLPLSPLSHVEAKPLSTSRCPLKSPPTPCTSAAAAAAAAAGLLFSPRGGKLKQVKREENDSVFCGVSALFSRFSPAVYLQPASALMASLISVLSVSGCPLSSSLSVTVFLPRWLSAVIKIFRLIFRISRAEWVWTGGS